MKISLKKLSAAMLALGLLGAAHAADKIAADLALTQATLIDVAGGRSVSGKVVLLKGDSILAVVDQRELGRYAPRRTLRLPGKYLMPGLWDTHVHFGGGPALIDENKHLLALYLAYGITSVRDCSGDLPDTVLDWRAQINAGQLQGPTIFTSGAKLEGYKPLWKGTIEVGTPEEVSRALDKLQGQGVDFVKITENTLKPEIYLEALRQSQQRGLRTSGHIPVQLTLATMFDAGLGTVEHQSYLLRAATPREAELTAQVAAGTLSGKEAMKQSLASYDEATARASFRYMAAKGTAVVPTLSVSRVIAYLDRDDHAHDEALQYIGKGLRATYDWRVQRAAQDDAAAIAQRKAVFEQSAALLPLLQQEGVSIIAGTDAGFLNSYDYPGQALHDEIGLYVHYGLTPAQALRTAVINGPRFLGKLERYGALEAGKAADVLVLDANPLQNIDATRKIRTVISRGTVYDRAHLDRILAETKAWAAQTVAE
ncbi:amidohydrolase family protein [Duganella sp. FT80W]|uniref:Amidohydrolase family protein n=1 Tax=Duganella guangzhouensis TaxID=2666084 RepID=A0A6I2L9K0_9BURK|nr:amidohydrolase family protein [Duganella guangzhouensis]MRW94708.1 amidohydrolase family protein [Duganella guangzhouensis]